VEIARPAATGTGPGTEHLRMPFAMKVKRLHSEACLPRYASEGAAGLDLSACLDAPMEIAPGDWSAIPTGIAIALPPGHEGQVRPRSGLAFRHAITVLNAPGTIDEDYRGEVRVLLVNQGREPYLVQHGERIAQLVVAPVAQVGVEVAENLEETRRGEGGFGSTGLT